MSNLGSQKRPDYKMFDGFPYPPFLTDQGIQDALNFRPDKDDIGLVTYPRSGTHWTQQIVQLLKNKGTPVLSYADAIKGCPSLQYNVGDMEGMSTPRLYRTHIPADRLVLSPEAKYIWVVRNPKDCLVSYYHLHNTIIFDFIDGDFDVFFEAFLDGHLSFGDYFDHVLTWYKHRNDKNVLTVYYEHLKQDLKGNVSKIAKFMGKEFEELLKDESVMEKILDYGSLEFMKTTHRADSTFGVDAVPEADATSISLKGGEKSAIDYVRSKNFKKEDHDSDHLKVVRKGEVGGWRDRFNKEQNRRIDYRIQERLGNTELFSFWIDNNYI